MYIPPCHRFSDDQALLDVLVDGKFEKELADPGLLWRGSSNQIIHDLNAWREREHKGLIPCQRLA